ncbi:hypothetical protein, partial [Undibacterium sp.]|uniref:hypothetical protein n=1 Tax=Undibacterium sp. TaxID=1914977 RepID=UPI00374CC47A
TCEFPHASAALHALQHRPNVWLQSTMSTSTLEDLFLQRGGVHVWANASSAQQSPNDHRLLDKMVLSVFGDVGLIER